MLWKEQYKCNIAEVDKQHQGLFALVSELYDLLQLNDIDRYDDIQRVLGELADYTVYHFGYEEGLMKKYGIGADDFKPHEAEHIAFVKKIGHIQNQDIDAGQHQVIQETLAFAVKWIDRHILDTDKKYMKMLNDKGVF